MRNKKQGGANFQRELLHWYKSHHRLLPWRKTRAKIIHFLEERKKTQSPSRK